MLENPDNGHRSMTPLQKAAAAVCFICLLLAATLNFKFDANYFRVFRVYWVKQWGTTRENFERSSIRSMQTRIGMSSYTNACINRGQGGKSDFFGKLDVSTHRSTECSQRRLEAAQWIRVSHLSCNNKSQCNFVTNFTNQKVLLLTGPRSNPNHQLWDILFSLFPIGYVDVLPFTHWATPFSTCDYWMCDKISQLFSVLGHKGIQQNSRTLSQNEQICFKEVWVPKLAAYRHERIAPANFDEKLPEFRQKLVENFSSPTNAVLVYGREDARYRRWINAESVARRLANTSSLKVHYVPQMGSMPPAKQCNTFWNARVIIFPHGGHSANLICSRSGTKVLEMACAKTVGWFQGAVRFHKAMGFDYTYHQVPPSHCSETGEPDKDWNFLTPDSWLTVNEVVRKRL